MKLNDLKPAPGAKKARRRLGRGVGSGRGKTAGRGHKGQKSRYGFSQGAGWEGGRSRLIMRLPKRGFNRVKDPLQLVNLEQLNVFEDGATVDAQALASRSLIRKAGVPVKLLGRGDLEVSNLQISVNFASANAIKAVEEKGGSVTVAAAAAQDAGSDEQGESSTEEQA